MKYPYISKTQYWISYKIKWSKNRLHNLAHPKGSLLLLRSPSTCVNTAWNHGSLVTLWSRHWNRGLNKSILTYCRMKHYQCLMYGNMYCQTTVGLTKIATLCRCVLFFFFRFFFFVASQYWFINLFFTDIQLEKFSDYDKFQIRNQCF